MSDETLMTSGQDTNDTAGQQGNADAGNAGQTPGEGQPQNTEAQATQDSQQTESAKDEGQPEGAPESYADFDLPEGLAIDAATIDEVKTLAKELNLPQDKAQKLAALTAQHEQRRQEAFTAAREQWANDTKVDKEIGGDKLQENLAVAKKALDAFGDNDLVALLNGSGLGNHPAVVKAFVKIGKAISEDKLVTGRGSDGAPSDPAKRMFPSMN